MEKTPKGRRSYLPKLVEYSNEFAIRLERTLKLKNGMDKEFYHEPDSKGIGLVSVTLNKEDNSIQLEFFMDRLFAWVYEQKQIRDRYIMKKFSDIQETSKISDLTIV